jgi:ankyrin repeat protein
MNDSLFDAIRAGDQATVDRLLAANPGAAMASDATGLSALTVAAYHRQWPIVERILATAPDLDQFEAAIVGDVEWLRTLLDEADAEHGVEREARGGPLAGPGPRTGPGPLEGPGPGFLAGRGADDDATEPVDRRSSDGFTALHLAAFFGRPEAARLLLDRGADPNRWATGEQSVQPLHSAVAGAGEVVAALLIERGADVNSAQSLGYTPLMGAAQNGMLDTVELLLARGADAKAYNDDILTAAELADRAGHPGVAATIRAAGG